MAPRENWAIDVKIAGPASFHSFLDSILNSLTKSPTLEMGGISTAVEEKETREDALLPTPR